MADEHLTMANTDAQARVAAYLNELSGLLHGPRRRRGRILTELRDGLDQSIAHHAAHGRTPDQVAEAAIDELGTPQVIAAAFAGELLTAYARRTIAWYIATGPLVGIWWLLLLQPHPWRVGVFGVLAAIPVLPLIAMAVAAAAGTLAATGRLIRWLPEASPARATSSALLIAALSAIADLAMIGFYSQSDASLGLPAILAIGCSAARTGCSVVALIHTTRLRRCSMTADRSRPPRPHGILSKPGR